MRSAKKKTVVEPVCTGYACWPLCYADWLVSACLAHVAKFDIAYERGYRMLVSLVLDVCLPP